MVNSSLERNWCNDPLTSLADEKRPLAASAASKTRRYDVMWSRVLSRRRFARRKINNAAGRVYVTARGE